jgi:amino acid transporter
MDTFKNIFNKESKNSSHIVNSSAGSVTDSYQNNEKNQYEVNINSEDIDEINSFEKEHDGTSVKQGLKSRHVQIIALAGAIGTGLFVGSGSALATCGPAALLTGYLILSILVWFVMNQIAEVVTFIPIPGHTTIFALARRYTGNPSFAFAAGINLYYAQALISPAEITAAAFVIEYWTPINPGAWITIFWVSMVAINFCAVKYFGEIEFWIGLIKVITITGLIILGVVIFFGGAPNSNGVLGFHYWKDPGSFTEHLTGGSTGRFLAVWTSIIKSGFAFILSPELITACASEAEHPRVNLPKATSRFIYRMIFFYVCGSLTIGVIVAYNDPRLMNAISSGSSGAAASPFVIGIQNAGIPVLNHIVNAAILTSAYSCGNSQFFSATRTLHSMALRGEVPRFFGRTNKWGVPYWAVTLTAAINLVAYLNVSNSSAVVFNWLTNISTVSGFISWLFIGVIYLRFRKAIDYHNLNERITFRPPLQIFGTYCSLIFFSIVCLTNGYAVFFDFNANDFVAAYITLPIVVLLYVCHMLWYKNYRLWAPLDEIDCITGLEQVEKDEADYVAPVPKNFIMKIYYWLC